MATLYVRDVPDDVAETLKDRAAARGQSLSAFVAEQLTALAARPTNAQVAARLRARRAADAANEGGGEGASSDDILAALDAGRR